MSRPENGSIGTERKLDPRIARFAVGATFVALGVISLALPTIDSTASVDVLAHPPYSPAPAAILAEPALAIASCPPPTEQVKPAATPTEIVEPKPSPVDANYSCIYWTYHTLDCSGNAWSTADFSSGTNETAGCHYWSYNGGSIRSTCTWGPARTFQLLPRAITPGEPSDSQGNP